MENSVVIKNKKKIKARKKGNNYELYVVNLFKEIGFTNCSTSRFSSKELDNLKVDIYGLPFNVQCKAVEKLSPGYHEILTSMPNKEGVFNFVFHKRSRKGTVVSMTENDFVEIIKLMLKHGIISNKCYT